jgi:two-component system, sensor histidine kinase PdtaS
VLQVSGLAPGVPEYEALVGAFAIDPAWAREGPFKVGDTLWAVSMELADSDIYLVEGWRRAPLDARSLLSALWAVSAPLLLWLIAVAAMWFAVELYIVRPLMTVERLARAYARGEDTTAPDSFRNAPLEIASLRRTLAAMAKTLRGREIRLTEALQEERALLREVNHRVNNNLQLVASLLSIQARTTTVEQQAIGLARAHDRIQLLALAHNQIYGSGQVHDVRVDELASEIARQLTAARGSRSARIMLNIDMQPATAPVDHAVPLAFLIGESVSQALDMLEGADRATLDVTLRREGDAVVFSVSSPDRHPRAAVSWRAISLASSSTRTSWTWPEP